MYEEDYFRWLTSSTKTDWWHDSADPNQLQLGLERGAVGVTTNPYLSNLALCGYKDIWWMQIQQVESKRLSSETKAGALMRIPVIHAAEKLLPVFERSKGKMGYVCAQVNPARAGDRERMFSMARRFHSWAPNIAVKLPATAAGLDVLEDCTAEGITVTATVSFTVPQVIAIAEKYRRGIQRAGKNGVQPGKCFAVIMIGRLDDHLREIAHDSKANVDESDIRQAGLAVTKRAYAVYKEREYEAILLIAAFRGTYHVIELAGAEAIMSIAPKYQEILLSEDLPREERINADIDAEVVERLSQIPEFVRAYDPEGMMPRDFIAYGATQKTLTQFYEVGWRLLENF